jgi:ligand-binding sensor domain-containing protein
VLRSTDGSFEAVGPRAAVFGDGELLVSSFAEDASGTLWLGTNEGLMSWREGAPVDVRAGLRLGIVGGRQASAPR